jgi:molecular chaperone HscC
MYMIGIDLGTTNSLVAYWKDGEPLLIPNILEQVMTPSVVGINDEGQIIVGEVAKQRLQTHPGMTIAHFKRYMGSDKQFKIGRKKFRPEELSALVLRSLKADAEALLGEPITDTIISVPAYFSDAQRKATRAAGTLAGLNVVRLINEPTAAAIAHGLHQNTEKTFLVFDIGGGTFDVSILEFFDGVMQVHASSGDNHLGGEDFVDVLIKEFVHEKEIRLDKLKSKDLAKLRSSAEACKKKLTNEKLATIKLHLKGIEHNYDITREDFERISSGLILRIRRPLERALRDADIHADDLDEIILVGGASRMPVIRSLASKMLGQIPSAHINPDEVVALGTAVQVALVLNDSSLEDVVLTDVAPYTLGINVHNEVNINENLFHPIIERNSPVPVSRMDIFYTVSDWQQKLHLGVFQGEGRLAQDNVKLGELNLPVPRGKAGEESIEVRFTYDINGLLEVESTVVSTGLKKRLIIEGNPGVMTQKEIEARLSSLSDLKIHPRDRLGNAVLIARGERIYEESLGELRTYIGGLMQEFHKVLNRQDLKEIETMIEEVNLIFDQIEMEGPLNS